MNKKLVVLTVLAGTCFAYCPRAGAQAGGTSQSTGNAQPGIDQDIELLLKIKKQWFPNDEVIGFDPKFNEVKSQIDKLNLHGRAESYFYSK